jgi:Ca2+-binding EF-hand superfamily protein
MKTIPGSLVLAGFWLPAACLAAPEPAPGSAPAYGDGARRGRQQQFVEAWKQADTDGNGMISQQEFAAMKRIELLPEEKRTELFKRLDKDGDGSLSREELDRFVKPQEGKRQLMLRLKELDTDKNGGISLEEFKAGEFVKKLPPERQETLFRRLDVNGDGSISPLDHPAAERPGQPGPPHDARHLLRLLDKDGDGFLTLEEFRQVPFMRSLNENEQQQLFDKLDRNHDSKIDATEFSHAEHKNEGKPRPVPPRPEEGGPP